MSETKKNDLPRVCIIDDEGRKHCGTPVTPRESSELVPTSSPLADSASSRSELGTKAGSE